MLEFQRGDFEDTTDKALFGGKKQGNSYCLDKVICGTIFRFKESVFHLWYYLVI